MKKILIIPSWYPSEARPVEGSFFREQAMAMKDLYDIKIFYPQKNKKNRLIRLFNTLLFIFRIKPSIEFVSNKFINKHEQFIFKYNEGIGKVKFEEGIIVWHCLTAFEKIIETGWKPDLIHAQSTVFGGIISFYISKKYNIPYVLTEHNVFLLHSYTLNMQRLMKSALEHAAIVVAVSDHQKRMILMHSINCNPIVVGNMIDETIFTIAPPKSHVFTILYISFDSYIKDNETFFKAIKLFQQETREPFTVKLLGRIQTNEKTNAFEVLTNNFDLKQHIDIVGDVTREKIISYFQDADVLISASIAETFGISMCEALFCGIPIISTANGGVDEMIDNINGVKVNIKDSKAICEAILKIHKKEIVFDPQEIRNSVIGKFSKLVFIKKMDNIYKSAINVH